MKDFETPQMKQLSKIILILYVLVLLWLVLFKLSFDISSVLLDHQARSLNLFPFGGSSQGSISEIVSNIIVFIPFGLLLDINLKSIMVWRKLTYIFIFSIAVEAIQFVLAIGVTDITDVIMNTLGGLVGLGLYRLFNRYVDTVKLDRFIVLASTILLIGLLFLRFFVFKVRY